MTRHREVRLDTMGQIMHHLRFIEATGDSYDRVLTSIRKHLTIDHMLNPGHAGFGQQEFAHMTAVTRIPSEHSEDDAILPRVLGMPPLVYDKGLPPSKKE